MKTFITAAVLFGSILMAPAQTTWFEISTGTNKKLNTIDFPNAMTGYIGGNDSLLLKTIDGGQTWNQLNYSGITFYPGEENIVSIWFTDELIGYCAVGPYSGIYKTVDGGLNWTSILPAGNLCYNQGLFFFDEMNGFFGGAGCFQGELIEKMTSGVLGTTVINYSGPTPVSRITEIDFLDQDFGIASSTGGRFYRTTDSGLTWDSIPSGLPNGVPVTSVDIVNDTLIYAGYNNLGSGFGILRSVDAGLTWQEDVGSATFYYPAFLCVHHGDNGYVYSGAQPSFGSQGLIFESFDFSVWNYYDVDHPINDLTSSNDSTIFGVGDSGYVVVNQPLDVLSLSETQNKNQFVLYPNPADEMLYFSFDQSGLSYPVSVFSSTGEKLSESVSDGQLSVSHLNPGVYFVTIHTGNEIETLRFVKK